MTAELFPSATNVRCKSCASWFKTRVESTMGVCDNVVSEHNQHFTSCYHPSCPAYNQYSVMKEEGGQLREYVERKNQEEERIYKELEAERQDKKIVNRLVSIMKGWRKGGGNND